MAPGREVLVDESLDGHPARARPARGGVDQLDHLGPGHHHPPVLHSLADETELGSLDPAQGYLLLVGEREPGAVEVDGVPEAAVVQPQPAPALEALGPLTARGRRPQPVRGSGGAHARRVVQRDGGQVQGALDRQLRGVQRVPAVRVAQAGPAQVHRHADLRPAQAHLPVRLQQLALEVLRDGHPVRGDRPPLGVPLHHGLADQQVRTDLRVRQPDPARHPAARQVQIALGVQPGGLQPRYRAVDQAQRAEAGLGQLDLAVEAAGLELHVRGHRPTGQFQPPADPHPAQLEGGHPARHRRRPVQQQSGDHPGAHAALGPPDVLGVRIVPVGGAGAEIADAARAVRVPHAAFRSGEIRRFLVRARLGHGGPPPLSSTCRGTLSGACDIRGHPGPVSASDTGGRWREAV